MADTDGTEINSYLWEKDMNTKTKSQAELEIETLQDVFNIATTGFEQFSKDAGKNSSSGDYSTAASSGYSSTAASSGDYSTAASSGDSSTAASSGNYSKAASSGDCSTAASSGYCSKAASSGDYSKAASSGYSSTAASSGDCNTAASSGDCSTAASSGDCSTAASSGYCSKAASSGDSSGCTAIGYRAAVSGDVGNLIMASEYIEKAGKLIPVGGKADIVDGKKLKPKSWYIVEGGEWVEVDFTDGVFSRVVSSRKGVKKVKNDRGEIAFVVSDDQGNSAHGKTLKEAAQELQFKTASRDVDQYRNMPMTTRKTPQEWAFVYRIVTGACQYGTAQFMASKGKLKKKYTLSEILEQTRGAFGHDKFREVATEAA